MSRVSTLFWCFACKSCVKQSKGGNWLAVCKRERERERDATGRFSWTLTIVKCLYVDYYFFLYSIVVNNTQLGKRKSSNQQSVLKAALYDCGLPEMPETEPGLRLYTSRPHFVQVQARLWISFKSVSTCICLQWYGSAIRVEMHWFLVDIDF